MVHNVGDLQPDHAVIEDLRGRVLRDESLTIRPAWVLQQAPIGSDREQAFRLYRDHFDLLAGRVKDVPEEEIDAAIDAAPHAVRHQAE